MASNKKGATAIKPDSLRLEYQEQLASVTVLPCSLFSPFLLLVRISDLFL